MWALFYSIGIEIVYWLFYALLTWPYAYINTKDLLSLVVPIIVTNTPAVALFIGVLEATTRQQDSEKRKLQKLLLIPLICLSKQSMMKLTVSIFPKPQES